MSLKKYLTQFTKEQLIGQIIELHKKYKDVQTYYEWTLNPNNSTQVEKTKKRIHKLFNDINGPKPGEAGKEITAFKKLSPSPDSLSDLMLWYVECGVEFTNNYGDINERFYINVEKMFSEACEFIRKNELENMFKQRCNKIVKDTENIGWGFHDEISFIYYEFFGE